MTVLKFIQSVLPNASEAFYDRMRLVTNPRHIVAGEVKHWMDLRGQINAATGKINSYRDIRKITMAEGRTTPSLGTLRNYLGEGGDERYERARNELQEWFREFQTVEAMFKEEHKNLLTPDDWIDFRERYNIYMGF